MTGVLATCAAAGVSLGLSIVAGWTAADRLPAVQRISDRIAATLCHCEDCANR